MNLKYLELPFPEDCIEWRILQSGKTGDKFWGMAAAYVSARAVMDRLDLVCGKNGWYSKYRESSVQGMAPGFICGISILIGDEWITKEDGSEQSDNDPFKGGISGAFKRAAVHWGIGRYLYDLEQGFVTIVEKGTKGAKMGQTKDKERFYWIPPKLPEWALPKKDYNESSGKAVNDGTHKQKFSEADKAAASKAIEQSLASTEPYVITIGKHKGKLLKDINKEELKSHKIEINDWLKSNPKMTEGNKKLSKELIEEIDKVIS